MDIGKLLIIFIYVVKEALLMAFNDGNEIQILVKTKEEKVGKF